MKVQLDSWHRDHTSVVEFAGFDLPIMYSSIKEEHMAVRNRTGIFDVSHMGRMIIEGSKAEYFLNKLVPRDLSKTPVGRASYTFMLNEKAGFRDDVVFIRLKEDKFLLVWNAGNLEKIPKWMESIYSQQEEQLNLSFKDISRETAMFALQGPLSKDALTLILGKEPPKAWSFIQTTINKIPVLISGTGYSGEAGFEIITFDTTVENPNNALKIWKALLDVENPKVVPCGLGARNSLRLEAGFPLYGNDIDENIDPISADLFFPPFVHMSKSDFIGKDKLVELEKNTPKLRRIGIMALKKGPSPRKGMDVFKDGEKIGYCVSGGFSPLLNIGIGMIYINREECIPDTTVQFEARKKFYDCKITKFPLYDASKYGSKRKS